MTARRVALAGALVLLATAPSPATAATTTPNAADKTGAEVAKLKAETRKLDRDDGLLIRLIPLVTALVAVGGLWATVDKAGKDRRTALKDAEEARRRSDEGRFDTRFDAVVTRLSSTAPVEQNAGAVLLDTLVRDGDAANAGQAIAFLLALMQSGQRRDPAALRTLGATLSKLLRDTDLPVDLRQVHATDLRLDGAELKGVDFAFSRLTGCSFKAAGLEHSKAVDAVLETVDLDDARLGLSTWSGVTVTDGQARGSRARAAKWPTCTFRRVLFVGADLRGVRFDGSRFADVDFEGAELAGATFRRVHLDDATRASIVKAKAWREATFDGGVLRGLERLAAS